MDQGQLEAVVILSEELHFANAARRLGISQPALSQKLHKLEADLGVSLFSRSQRRVRLTEAGKLFLVQARAALYEIERAIRTARNAAKGQIGSLSIGFVENASQNVLPKAVSAFRNKYPDVDLRLSEMISTELFEKLLTERIDMALMRPVKTDPSLETQLVLSESYVAALPVDHPLTSQAAVRISDLAAYPLIMAAGAKATYLRSQFMSHFARRGYEMSVGQEVNQLPAIIGLVSSGVGYALLPESSVTMSALDVEYRPLADPDAPSADLIVAWRSGATNPIIKPFADCLPIPKRGDYA
ncbi:LysR family transcriptional regulator [Psychromarinibacter sp. C21-152]|uniref:LysR family transcriptional regulator n=2 Tax=Psychromarinibacter sediminicola TaxID=3033385 RepID=A0AAE3NUB8_9RHOB|nr:LysR family transcriptional regulator [Psychromarinibacter sediminicola]